MDPEIAKVFKNSTTISGKSIFLVLLTHIVYSRERNQQSSLEGFSQEKKVKSPDQGRGENGAAEIEGDHGEAQEI